MLPVAFRVFFDVKQVVSSCASTIKLLLSLSIIWKTLGFERMIFCGLSAQQCTSLMHGKPLEGLWDLNCPCEMPVSLPLPGPRNAVGDETPLEQQLPFLHPHQSQS